MRILYAINSGEHGGAEKHTLHLAEGMHNRGHEVYIWMPEGPIADEFREVGVAVVTIKIRFDLDPSYIFALTKFLKEKKIDILHAHELKAVGNALVAGFLAGTKIRVSHTHTPISEWQISSIKKFLNIKLFYSPFVNLFATREIALTPSRKRVKVKEGIKESKLEVIPNGLKIKDFTISDMDKLKYRQEILSRYEIPQDAYVFGAMGRLTVEKGIPVLMEAFYRFYNSSNVDKEKTYLLVAGGGDLKDVLREKIKDLGMVSNIIMPGIPFAEEDKIKFLSSFDTFVFPSLAEGFGIVPLEAMAMSLTVICSDLEVLQEVGGSTVLFFETGDPDNLSDKMYNIYSKRDRLERVKNDARRRVEQLYSMKEFVQNYANLYSELMEARQ